MTEARFVATIKVSGNVTQMIYIPKSVVNALKTKKGQNIDVILIPRKD